MPYGEAQYPILNLDTLAADHWAIHVIFLASDHHSAGTCFSSGLTSPNQKDWVIVFYLLGVLISPIDKFLKIVVSQGQIAGMLDILTVKFSLLPRFWSETSCIRYCGGYLPSFLDFDKFDVFVPLSSSTFCMSNSNLWTFLFTEGVATQCVQFTA